MNNDIRSLLMEEILAFLKTAGQPAYRAQQLAGWLYKHPAMHWADMRNLPQPLLERLAGSFTLHTPALRRAQNAGDGTRKFLWRLADGAFVESVLIPATPALYGETSDRLTLCLSTQVGCAYGCKFCASGLRGWKRNLFPHEIVGQVIAAERAAAGTEPGTSPPDTPTETSRRIGNLVFMGMGEPLANYDNVLKSIRILNAPWGMNIGARKITVSTCGLAPEIRRLAGELLQLRLAVSLHGAEDSIREKIMPVNRRYPLKELIAACEHYRDQKGRMIGLEYILINGVNDDLKQAGLLAALARKLHARVNLIPCNPVEGTSWASPPLPRQKAFLAVLVRQKIAATLRAEKGGAIDAACGQLRLREENAVP